MKKISLIVVLSGIGTAVLAAQQEAKAVTIPEPGIGLSVTEILVLTLLVFALVLLLVSVVLFKAFKVMAKEQLHPTPYKKYIPEPPLDYEEWLKTKKSKPGIWSKLLSLKPIEQEQELVIPHAYDGIHELNNPVPKWFNILFYGTMIFAAGYIYYYHIGEYGQKQDQEYETEMAKAAEDKRKFLAQSVNKVDENTVKIDKTLIANGKNVFMANCIACHGEHGQGLVGPNLTDEFWLHGGSINDIFKTIKYGVPAKGMVSWEKSMSSVNIAEVANYIVSLQGSHPANAKAPQGEKYEAKAATDTLKNESTPKK
ncbi:cbb3-type cytochrome c oxidase N-terminal domain-containing protein [Pedobacter sp. ASV12]|uniref:cbb3-type cytochrome c oxidase N-terminal domain-containing protein n=1 Tax=Pedobacter sp. ASV12 TaxID=2795120 RepID=UPI001E5957AD|nr:cbb3-type cytochrome c oxidase N-terminal domain-containing protein [Pedobacter sp. ASV12]